MQLEKRTQGSILELILRGALDNDSSIAFRDEIESSTREGWHNILVDLSGVTYLSSAGMAALLAAKKLLESLHGLFGVHSATPEVEQVLNLTRLLDVLRCDPQAMRAIESSGTRTIAISSTTRFAREEGISMQLYPLHEPRPLRCQVIGNPRLLSESTAPHVQTHQVTYGPRTFGLGLGTLSQQSDPARSHYGEFLSIAGAIAQSPQTSGGRPDYSLAAADFVPTAQILYGVKCEGDLDTLIRFEPDESGTQVPLSTLVRVSLSQCGYRTAGIVILADCAGLVGAQLRRFPATNPGGTSRFSLPGIRDWLSFSGEQIHRHNLVLIVGIAALKPGEKAAPLQPLLRPLGTGDELSGHFHAAVFPYRPLKKRTLELQSSVTNLFDSGSIEDVLHLLHDHRPLTGPGESELFGGACWIGPIENVAAEEGNA